MGLILHISATFRLIGTTPPISDILYVKNVGRAFVVCGFLIKWFKKYPENMKKIVWAAWELPAK